MLTEYKGQVFNVSIEGNQAKLWIYKFVEGFKKYTTEYTTDNGNYELTYYEKIVPITEISGLFSIIFEVFIGELPFSIDDVRENNNIVVLCSNIDYANEHGFSELERGVWIAEKSIDLFDKIQMKKCNEDTNEDTITDLNKQQFIDMWNKYEFEPSISYFFKNQTNN